MKKKHQKHADLKKPQFGSFGRNEWALIGSPCGTIKKLASGLIELLSEDYKLGFVDADHKSVPARGSLQNGAVMEYTDKIDYHRFDLKAKLDSYQYRQFFNEQDLVIVNGNHFKAKAQVVLLDPKKEQSLQKKLDRLTDVQLFVQVDDTPVYDYLKEALPHWNSIPVFKLTQVKEVAGFLRNKMKQGLAPLSGLILAGGKSRRMGTDKSLIEYYGKPQREYLYDLIAPLCESCFMSCRPEQIASFIRYPGLPDSFLGLGPFGAILSAFRQNPNQAWLVVACDMPLLDNAALNFLIGNRNPSKIATAFLNPDTGFPDPLLTIWEPRAYPVLLQFLAQGFSCPRKVLINSDIELLQAPNPEILKNVNSPEEYREVVALIAAQG